MDDDNDFSFWYHDVEDNYSLDGYAPMLGRTRRYVPHEWSTEYDWVPDWFG